MKLQILLVLMLLSCLWMPSGMLGAAGSSDAPVISNSSELPSASFLKMEKRSLASTVETASLSAPMRGFTTFSSGGWQDPYLPGADGEWSNAANVGAPVGDATWPIIVSILVLYLIYRSVAVSRKRNNF
jgi:hypothetical protein